MKKKCTTGALWNTWEFGYVTRHKTVLWNN